MLQNERTISWQRARLIVVGQGRAGKTSFLRALRDLPFKHTKSTAGVAIDTVETTDVNKWSKLEGTQYEQVGSALALNLNY